MKPDILQITNVPDWIAPELERSYTVHKLADAADRDALLAEVAPRIRGAVTMGKADAALIDALPALEIISSFGVGYDGVDAAHAKPRGITVTNTPGVLDDDVANLAVMFVLSLCYAANCGGPGSPAAGGATR